MEKVFKLLINGRLIDGASTMPVINPADGKAFTDAPRADVSQVEQAVAAAKFAFPAWANQPWGERKQLLLTLANVLEQRIQEFAALLTKEQGKPLAQAEFECMGCVFMIRGMVEHELPPVVLRDDGATRATEYRTPLGVVAAITPWNFPLILLINKLTPALLAGNTIVIKPAPTTPLTTLLLGEVCAAIFPAGVVNVITDLNDLGSVLTQNPDVAKISFTGSTATGRKVMSSAATTIKRVTLELGGNDAALVLSDADVKKTARNIFDGAMLNSGQICVAVKRVYVPDSLYDEFCNELAAFAKEVVVGDGFDPNTEMGPVQNIAQYQKLKQLLEEVSSSGKVIAGGIALDRPGYFISPTIVRDVKDSDSIVSEEQFGPILPVLSYHDVDEAIRRINDSEYGLGATIWTTDLEQASDIAQRISAGTVWVNKHMDIAPDLPFRGTKQSGFGVELGSAGLEEYTQARVINIALASG